MLVVIPVLMGIQPKLYFIGNDINSVFKLPNYRRLLSASLEMKEGVY